ncbi:MAG: hypothetical protein IPM10_05585 [Chitinophagaceae bacterium]|nr:hypothetical protein [Chitinophagaceae bacterium]
MVNPTVRYNEYGAKGPAIPEEAKMQDTEKPKALFLIGQGLRSTPEQFGGGAALQYPF